MKGRCKSCGAVLVIPAAAPSAPALQASQGTETTLYQASPSMFRNHPILFVAGLALPAWMIYEGARTGGDAGFLVLGVLLAMVMPLVYIVWWLRCRATRLTVTDRMVTLNRGLLSRNSNEVRIADVRNVRLQQGPLQRLLGVGGVAISSAGQSDIEIEISGIPAPHQVREIINQYRQ